MINLAKATLSTLLLALSFSMQTSAQTSAANNAQTAASIPRKADGSVDFDKWFEGKNRDQQYEMVDSLTDLQDERAYTKYLLAENAKKKAIIVEKKADNAKLEAIIVEKKADNAKLEAIIVEKKADNAKLEAIIVEKKADNAKLEAIIISKNNDWISLLARRAALNNGNVGEENKQNIRKALLDPHIPNEIKDKLRLFLNE